VQQATEELIRNGHEGSNDNEDTGISACYYIRIYEEVFLLVACSFGSNAYMCVAQSSSFSIRD